ncbi:MAG: ATP-dependent DNA ligase [Akkermansiaceae bacterium]|nr:ATP-dependent DNA ligase [Akkermansiaceae bacterium]
MKDFTQLYLDIDSTTKTKQKVAALVAYFEKAQPADAAWALFFLTGQGVPRAVNTRLLREAIVEASGYPLWLVEESYDTVGDLAETVALLHPPTPARCSRPFHELIEGELLPLKPKSDEEKIAILRRLWSSMDHHERFVWNKCITGGFRVGVSRGLVARALASLTGLPPASISHRLMGSWQPTAEDFETLVSRDSGEADPGQPYPFYLASPLEKEPQELGERSDWLAEWKWDGIRAQLIKRQGKVMIWSRGEELITDRFPELSASIARLPDDLVLDGEIMGWRDDTPLPFLELQRRIGRKSVGKKLLQDVPVIFMAYDLMEQDGRDIRETTQESRRSQLEDIFAELPPDSRLRLSPLVTEPSWEALAELRQESRQRGVEGLMLKHRRAPYQSGRIRGHWWKWKIEPYTVDAVLTYAQKGHGRRAGLFSDYTFGVWDKGELVTFAKAYSGLTDKEMREVDRFIKANTLERFGPVRRVKPELVFELACENIQRSSRHKSGIAVRFPRISRQRPDKTPEQANQLDDIKRLLSEPGRDG